MIKTTKIPLWLAAHEAAHVVARIQLTAAWHLSGLERPGCMRQVRYGSSRTARRGEIASGGTLT